MRKMDLIIVWLIFQKKGLHFLLSPTLATIAADLWKKVFTFASAKFFGFLSNTKKVFTLKILRG